MDSRATCPPATCPQAICPEPPPSRAKRLTTAKRSRGFVAAEEPVASTETPPWQTGCGDTDEQPPWAWGARTATGRAAAPVRDPKIDQEQLFIAWRRDRDRSAQELLLERYMPLARSLARRYGRTSEPFEDLLQVASLGLVKAIDRYELERGHSFAAFAVPTILGEMRRYFRDAGWATHVPRAAKERALAVRNAVDRLRGASGRTPTANQLAEYLELDIEQVLDALVALEAYETYSLEARRCGGDEEGLSYAETLGDEDERYELIECDVTLRSVLTEIAPRERRILRLRFVDDLTQSEIAERVGISQMQVSRVLRRSLERLRALTRSACESP
jgi:RNA polymerase sigma-B factor